MVFLRQVLNSIKWRDDTDVSRCKVAYLHRGSRYDMIEVSGDEISELGRFFFKAWVDDILSSHSPYLL